MKNPAIPSSLLFVAMAGALIPQAWAEDTARQESVKACETSRFIPHEPNYMVYRWADNDESALRVHYSFRYTLCPLPNANDVETKSGERCLIPYKPFTEVYFKYTGDFDFYQGTRPSSPVINRISNPGIHVRRNFSKEHGVDHWVDVGLEHLSNGQVVDIRNKNNSVNANEAYWIDEHAYFDSISRGMNFLSVEYKKSNIADIRNVDFTAKLRAKYFSKDTDITWGPLSGTGTTIADYDRLRLSLTKKDFPGGEVSVAWTVGDKGFGTSSWDVGYTFEVPCMHIPLFIRYHNGPLQTLSNYTQNQRSIGFGIRFTR